MQTNLDTHPLFVRYSEKTLSQIENMQKLTHERLLQLVSYDKETGVFTRRVTTGSMAVGSEVGSKHCQGYREASIDGERFLLHRLAVFYVTGQMPDDSLDVDHRDRDRSNNVWLNLRVGTRSFNLQNQSVNGRPTNKAGMLGVSFHRKSGLWRARAIVPGTRKEITTYHATAEEAAAKAIEVRKNLYEGFVGCAQQSSN